MKDSNRTWYLAHLVATIVLAVIAAVSIVFTALELYLPPVNSFGGVIIFTFVVPGTLLVFAINHLILWRRRPRVIRTSDKVVIIIVAALILLAMLLCIDEELGFAAVFFVVPAIMLAGVVSTIMLAVNNARAGSLAAPAAPVEPGTAPVAQTLDQLFPEPAAAEQPVVAEQPAEAEAPVEATGDEPASPYGPKT